MNYAKCYLSIIKFRRQHPLYKTLENIGQVHYHHIFPLCCGGTDTPQAQVNQIGSNLIGVTTREHFVLHELLVKMCRNGKFSASINCAWWFMANVKVNGFNVKLNSRLYSAFMKDFIITKRVQHTGWHHTEESKRKISEASRGKKHNDNSRANMKAAQNRQDVKSKKSKALRGRHLTNEHKLAISKANTIEVRHRKRIATKGIPKSDIARQHIKEGKNNIENKKKRSITWQNKTETEINEWKIKLSKALVGRKLSDKTKEKLRKPKDIKWKLSQLNYRIKKSLLYFYYLMII